MATSGDFAAGNVRTTATDFNPDRGTYEVDPATNMTTANHTFSMLPPGSAWILGTFERQTVSEGGETAVATSCFDSDGPGTWIDAGRR